MLLTSFNVAGSVHVLVPVARPMKFATVSGASLSNSLHVSRPMVVSKRTVGPVGTAGGSSCAIVEGASGRASGDGAFAGGATVAGGVGWGASGGADCAKAIAGQKSRASAQKKCRGERF